jgi:hypothetical protein
VYGVGAVVHGTGEEDGSRGRPQAVRPPLVRREQRTQDGEGDLAIPHLTNKDPDQPKTSGEADHDHIKEKTEKTVVTAH